MKLIYADNGLAAGDGCRASSNGTISACRRHWSFCLSSLFSCARKEHTVVSSRLKSWLVIGALLFILASVALAVWFSILGIWAEVRDAFLVGLAVVTFVALAILAYAAFVMISLAVQIKKEITPVLDSLRETTDTVRETAKVANELTLTPGVKAASALIGAVQMAGIFFGIGRARKRAEKRAQRRRELARSGEK
jgi:hypothetical protein